MYDEHVNASKGKVPVKGKGKQGDGKGGKSEWRSACEEYWKPGGCSQGHNCPRRGIIQGDSEAGVQSVALLVTILLNAHVQ